MPKVSVVMNCYNGEKYLREAIDSVYAQTFDDWEIIFWDNASTDQTAEIAQSYDGRLRYFRSPELITLGAARRLAVTHAQGDWIAFLDCDDFWTSDKLQMQINALAGTEYVLCYAGIREITSDGRLIREVLPEHGSGDLLEKLLLQFDVNMVTPMVRRDTLRQYHLNFDENVTASEEYNLFVRLAAKGPVLAMPAVLGVYRVSQGSLTDRQIAQWAMERRYTLDQLKGENRGIEDLYPTAFREAYARGVYYEVRYLMSESRVGEARRTMSKISGNNIIYKLLQLSLFIPGLWHFIHGTVIRRRLLPLVKRLMNSKLHYS